MKRISYLLAACLAAAFLLPGCNSNTEVVPELLPAITISYDTTMVRRGDIDMVTQYDAEVTAEVCDVAFETSGRIESLYVTLGDRVTEGQLIAELDVDAVDDAIENVNKTISSTKTKRDYEAKQCSLKLQIAQLELEQLTDEDEISAKNVEISNLKGEKSYISKSYSITLEQLNTELAELQEKRTYCYLYAPCSGQLVSLSCAEESNVMQDSVIMQIAVDGTRFVAYQTTSATLHLAREAADTTARIGANEYPVALIPYDPDELNAFLITGTSPVARFSLPEDAECAVGDYAALTLYDARYKNVLYIPSNAVYVENAFSHTGYVYVIDDSGSKVYTEITFTAMNDAYVVIESGLEEGDVIFVKQ